jgi:hypothetical protein
LFINNHLVNLDQAAPLVSQSQVFPSLYGAGLWDDRTCQLVGTRNGTLGESVESADKFYKIARWVAVRTVLPCMWTVMISGQPFAQRCHQASDET